MRYAHADKTSTESLHEAQNMCNKDGTCSRCGGCCATPVLKMTTAEKTAIRDYIKAHNITRQDHTPKTEGLFFDTLCPFCEIKEDKTTACTVYEVRPRICRSYQCSIEMDESTSPEQMEQILKDMDIDETYILSIMPVNMTQTFFPEEELKEGDIVMINQGILPLHDQMLNQVFLVKKIYDDDATCNIYAIKGTKKMLLKQMPQFALTKGILIEKEE